MPAHGHAAVVIVAAGKGQRFGASDKILLPLAGKPLLTFALDAVEAAALIEQVVIVVGAHTLERVQDMIRRGDWQKVTKIVIGGDQRQDSVAAGIAALPASVDVVALHDGARPFAPPTLFDATVAAARRTGSAIAAIPVTDTIKRVAGDRIVETVPRADLWAAQTPQAFNLSRLREALAYAAQSNLQITDEASLFERMGWPVEIVLGASNNLKITYPADFELAAAWLSVQQAANTSAGQ
jgi:2-C-methyl-D-erythritol 4-phosphate cytidylyltransferase